jgi:hypothetical protein
MLVADPKQFYSLARTAEKYLALLRAVAANAGNLPTNLKRSMQSSQFMLGVRRVVLDGKDEDDEEPETVSQYQLAKPGDLVIAVRRTSVQLSLHYRRILTLFSFCIG